MFPEEEFNKLARVAHNLARYDSHLAYFIKALMKFLCAFATID